MPASQEHWSVDKRVPLALIFTVAVQTGVFIWWMAGLDQRVEQLGQSDAAQDARIMDVERVTQGQAVAAAGITAQIGAMRETLDQVRQDQRQTNDLLRQLMDGRTR